MKQLLCLLIALTGLLFKAQTESDSIQRKKINLSRISHAPKIDGVLDEEFWQNAAIAQNFVERNPKNGKQEPEDFKTIVKIAFDDTGVYFGAVMNDPEPGKINKELTERDDMGNDDLFAVTINGYNDHQQAVMFIVQASGVQADAKIQTNSNDDFTWNAIWNSAVKITDHGWTAEMKIPYSELRFPKKDIQQWGMNFMRYIQRSNQNLTWNFVNNKKASYLMYDGVVNGIEHINLQRGFPSYPISLPI